MNVTNERGARGHGRRSSRHRAPDDHLGFLLWQGSRRFVEALRMELADLGHDTLSLAHVNLMPFLDIERTRARTLAERTGLSKQAVAKTLGELERAGYITRTPDPDDARERIIRFTRRGLSLLDDGERAKSALETRCLAGMTAAERKRVIAVLKTINAALQPSTR